MNIFLHILKAPSIRPTLEDCDILARGFKSESFYHPLNVICFCCFLESSRHSRRSVHCKHFVDDQFNTKYVLFYAAIVKTYLGLNALVFLCIAVKSISPLSNNQLSTYFYLLSTYVIYVIASTMQVVSVLAILSEAFLRACTTLKARNLIGRLCFVY